MGVWSLYALCVVTLLVGVKAGRAWGGGMFTQCGGTMTQAHGTIHSPNFPHPFPMPIKCRWIIHAPQEKNIIIIYFTQFFLLHSFYVTEYDDLEESSTRRALGPINAKEDFKSVVVYSPYVVLDLVVTDDSNLNLRVEPFIMGVHGFNITYEIVPRHSDTKASCSVDGCSALGHCLASRDYSSYWCRCAQGFYGQECEKGPHCDPDRGLNPCMNGGKCRYFSGSLFLTCVCPIGYDGKMCEIKQEPLSNECPKDHKCSHKCVKKPNGALRCVCKTGFRLESDGFTCKELERYRVMVTLPVDPGQDNLEGRLQTFVDNTNKTFMQCRIILQLAGLTPERFEMDSVSNTSISFHFFMNKTETRYIDQALSYLTGGGLFFGVRIDPRDTRIVKEPELKILSVENSDKGPALEGKLLTLTCVARGSDNLQFRWFKDGMTFDMLLTHRNAWEIRLPETISEMQISQLNIDGVTMYDRGRFTCEVRDFGQVLSNWVDLDVMLYPQVEVTPLTVSAYPGQVHSFRCLSPDDSRPSFTYSWLKNGNPIKETDPEEVEALQPSGSRLLIKGAQQAANYTCQVTNQAGTSSRIVYLFVGQGSSKGEDRCGLSIKDGIRWNQTLGGHFNLQKCPTDQTAQTGKELEDEKSHNNALSRLGGFTKRRCECTKTSCKWTKPNYSGCQSIHLIKLFHRVMKVQQGYQEFRLDSVYRELYVIAQEAQGRMLAGDLDITATILYMILTTATDFPSLIHNTFDAREIVDFLNIVLEKTVSMTDDEKQDLQTGARVVQIIELLTDLHKHRLINLTNVRAPKIAMEVIRLPEQPVDVMTAPPTPSTLIVKRDAHQAPSPPSTKVLSALYDQSILKVLHVKNTDGLTRGMFVSDVVSVVPLEHRWKVTSHFLVEIPHRSHGQRHTSRRTTNLCYSWNRQERESTDGEWRGGSCHTVDTLENLTRCACLLPGHFTVVTVPVNQTVLHTEPDDSFAVLIVTCVLSICCIGCGLAVYVISWRYLRHAKHSIHLNFLLSLLGLNVTCLLCVTNHEQEALCIGGKMVLQFFLVAAFTFLFLDGVQLFAGLHVSLNSLVSRGCGRFSLIGWGIPVLSVVFMISMMELIGYDKHCDHWCFWNRHHPYFYSILIPIIILIMCHAVVSLLCVFIVVKWNSDYHYRKRWKMMLECGRSELLLILLVVLFCVSTHVVQVKDVSAQLLFLLFDLALVVSSVFMCCFLKKTMRLSVRHLCNCTLHLLTKEEFPAVRNYAPPDLQQERSRVEAERIHEYCDRVDQERYTSKHRRQLRFLLNSSSSGSSSSSSGACCSGSAPSEHDGGNSKDSWAPRSRTRPGGGSGGACVNTANNNNADSGISEGGTESEKSLSQARDEEGNTDIITPAGGGGSQRVTAASSSFSSSSHKQKQSGRKSMHNSNSNSNNNSKRSKDKHKSCEEGDGESRPCSKSSTMTSELQEADVEGQVATGGRGDDVSSYLLGFRYGARGGEGGRGVKAPSEVSCLLRGDEEEEMRNSQL